MTAFRSFWLTLFAIGAVALIAGAASMGQPWTAAAFVVFFTSRVARSEIKRRVRRRTDDAVGRAHLFILVTAAGWLGAGLLAVVAAVAGEGQEWIFVAPLFLAFGAAHLYIAFSKRA